MNPSDDDYELIDVRLGEQLPITRLEPWLRTNLKNLNQNAPLEVKQFGGGHANLTYLLTIGQRELVLRRPPLGTIAPTSHDMRREHRVLAHLKDIFPLAPQSYAFCSDHSVLGCDFHVMERRHGFVIRQTLPNRFRGNLELNRRLSTMIVDTLTALHRVDVSQVGLSDLGHPEAFLARQLDGWTSRYLAVRETLNPHSEKIQALIDWLYREVPTTHNVTLIHNDYKLDNILVATTEPCTPVAVLDWDMATRGDPLVELGYLLVFWSEATDDPAWRKAAAMPTHYPGGLTRDEVVQRYSEQTGFDVDQIRWYQLFGIFKLIVILQQIYVRFLKGQTQDHRFSEFAQRVDGLVAKTTFLLTE